MMELKVIQEEELKQQKDDMSIDGGSTGSGLPLNDPTQERGTDAWQRALEMGLKINAKKRRN